jgi:hypothetical protein
MMHLLARLSEMKQRENWFLLRSMGPPPCRACGDIKQAGGLNALPRSKAEPASALTRLRHGNLQRWDEGGGSARTHIERHQFDFTG